MYTQQREFEQRTRKMTRGVAHELKTPLPITKTYVENWQYIDEEDRDDYCKNMVDQGDDIYAIRKLWSKCEFRTKI